MSHDCAVSMVSVFELFAGVFRCNAPEREGQNVSTFLELFHLLPFDLDAARTRLSCRKKPLEMRGFVTYKSIKKSPPNIDDYRLLQDLPKHHGDPFDRMLVCQAKRLGLGISFVDKIIDAYQPLIRS